jgi:steroid delta-isomerase-like uncharacterized protein
MADSTASMGSPSELARGAFRFVFEERDLDHPERYWTERSTNHFLATGEAVRGGDELAGWFRRLFAAAPDWEIEIENVLDDGDRQAVVQWRGAGTFTGAPFQGIEPTGRRVELRGADVMRFDADGKIEQNTIYYDGAEFARQIGLLPARDSAGDRALLAAFNAATRVKGAVRASMAGRRDSA